MRCKLLSALLVAALFSVTAAAQVPTGTISGRVTSSDGLALPGVTVTATSPSLQGERTIVTTANGDFILPLLPPGDYRVMFELSGFQATTRLGLQAIAR